jgi:hypothetical protein
VLGEGTHFASCRNWKPEGSETVPITFPIVPSTDDREGYIWAIVSDVDTPRPAAVDITVGGITTRYDLISNKGAHLDVVDVMVSVPALASTVTVQAVSIGDGSGLTPASLAWHFVSWELPVRLGGGGEPRTKGFWGNKNGQKLIDEADIDMLNACCLRDEDGNDMFWDEGNLAKNRKAYKAWSKNARAKNMSYMLSAQLAAMKLNVSEGFVDGGSLIYGPGCGNLGDDYISINALISAAADALCNDGLTFSGDENRDYQECLKTALDDANNNLNFVQ